MMNGLFPDDAQFLVNAKARDWKPGPWDAEPDRVAWKEDGFHCLIKRGPSGAWCGYVAVPPGHPWYKQDYSDLDVDCHGCLTYSNHCSGEEDSGICHKPEPGEPDAVWWLGFDCFHSGDAVPAYGIGGTYRTMDYAASEVRRLLKQVAAQA